MNTALNRILNKCNIYYNDALISEETVLRAYYAFFMESVESESHSVAFAFHTGSVCFDAVSIAAATIGCISYNIATNDDIIASLKLGDMVMYRGQRYRWLGIETEQKFGNRCLILEQDGTGKNGPSKIWLPYENNKHLISPYYGSSKKTDGRGIKRKITNREEFLSYIFELPNTEIPTQIDASVVVVTNRGTFDDLCKGISIEYSDGKRVALLDIVPASYYTGNGIEYGFGSNPNKAEPVFKVTGNLSTARELVLDKHGNKIVGLIVSGNMINDENSTELFDLLRRKSLKFAMLSSTIYYGLNDHFIDLYKDASFFACTKEYLSSANCDVVSPNPYTEELSRQTTTIINNTIHPILRPGGFSQSKYSNIRNQLYILNQSNWDSVLRDEFVVTAQGLLNLFNTAIFTMAEMERAIAEGKINQTVQSPKARIEYLWDLAEKAGSMQDSCIVVADELETHYKELMISSPKHDALIEVINKEAPGSLAIVVPKAYYKDILLFSNPGLFLSEQIVCITANKFDPKNEYDAIIVVGEIRNRKFDVLRCISSKSVYLLLYDCEEKVFTYRKRKKQKYEYELNERIGVKSEPPIYEPETDEDIELELRRFSSLDELIDNYKLFDIHKLASYAGQSYENNSVSEVTHIGVFSNDEQILFSKFYSAVVFDAEKGTVTEKSPSDLLPGDVMVFTKKDDYTKNIVDAVYDRLLTSGKLSTRSSEMFEKTQYWKEALREYKEVNGLSYRDVALKLQELGSSLQEVSVRQWLVEDSHIVGPRDEITMEYIALLTQDTYLMKGVSEYHEACRHVRHERREILKLIAKAINDKLMGFTPPEGSVLEVVYENVDKLSETRELEAISELEESIYIGINLVNRPITESEVLL